MARPLRVEYPGAVYHVMARGHERSAVFRDADDRAKFLALLASIASDEKWVVHGYCLMGNHYHLMIETPEGELSRGMRSLNGEYAQWFNRRHDRRGHVLEGRFRAVLVQKESHLLELHRYIVLNPVRARLAGRAADWRWSSYRATAGLERAPAWLETDWTLAQFARSRSAARGAFQKFVAMGKVSGREVDALERSAYLGDREFRRSIQDRIDGRKISDEIPLRHRRASDAISFEQIRKRVAGEWKVPEEALARRRGGDDKKAAIYLARKLTRLGGREIGARFGVKAARVSNIVTQIDSAPTSRLARRVQVLSKSLGQKV
jgi:REP element-mobilizing transposase RayT